MILSFLLQTNGNVFGWIFPLTMLGIFYFFFMLPQSKKQKAQAAFLGELKKGDEVVTASGIIGHINKIEDGCITLELDSKTFIKVVTPSISKEMTDQYKAKSK
jgi:preprotein translocase subunit YajC